MRVEGRLKRLEMEMSRRQPDGPVDWTAETVDVYAKLAESGAFAAEPDFATALAEFKAAVESARADAGRPLTPPADYFPSKDYPGMTSEHRRALWLEASHPVLAVAYEWLGAILLRVVGGIPPVTVGEFNDLQAWYCRWEGRWPHSPPFTCGKDGEQAGEFSPGGLAAHLNCGANCYSKPNAAKSLLAGNTAVALRRLRGLYPDGPPMRMSRGSCAVPA
jgi:hypothetical protein